MKDKEHIEEFAQLLDRLIVGEDVSAGETLDPGMVDIACTLAAARLSTLSRGREALRRRLGQQVTNGNRKRETPPLAAFSMGFATMMVLLAASLVAVLPLIQHVMDVPLPAEMSTISHFVPTEVKATPIAFPAVEQQLLSATPVIPSPTSVVNP
ncbi:MAG: hypothetical protein JXB30_11340 [Anaerolineae bacterium]|nr:hypothetical protein [Anaerolineae bacterium]